MALSDLVPGSRTIKTHGGEFEVHPLVLEDLAALVKDNEDVMNRLMEGNLDLGTVIKEAPDFVAKAIALAAREPDMVEVAKALPLGTQVQALKAVWELTVYDPKEFAATLSALLSLMGADELPVQEERPTPRKATGKKA